MFPRKRDFPLIAKSGRSNDCSWEVVWGSYRPVADVGYDVLDPNLRLNTQRDLVCAVTDLGTHAARDFPDVRR